MHVPAPGRDVRRRTWDNREGDLRHGSGGGAGNDVRMGQSSRAKAVPSLEASVLHDEGGRRAAGGSQTLTLHSSAAWTASCDTDWLKAPLSLPHSGGLLPREDDRPPRIRVAGVAERTRSTLRATGRCRRGPLLGAAEHEGAAEARTLWVVVVYKYDIIIPKDGFMQQKKGGSFGVAQNGA